MSRLKIETLKAILTNEYWLVVSLGGAFFSFFALNRGGVVVFIDACAVFVLLNLFTRNYPLKSISKNHLVTLAICVYLLGTSILFNPKNSYYGWMVHMVRMLWVVFAIHCLSRKEIKDWIALLFYILLSIAVCWQAIAHYIFKMPWGTFSNPHYLSSFSMLALPVIIYSLIATKGWIRFFFVPVAMLDLDLLLRIKSRPAILGVTVGAVFVFIFLVKGWLKWGSLLFVVCMLAALSITDYGGVYSNFEELIINFSQEERFPLWTATWNMLKDNTLLDWIFGNGIGSGRTIIAQYIPDQTLKSLIFPHNYFLELCYENGIVGVILVFTGIACLLYHMIKVAKKIEKKVHILAKFMIVIFLSWLVHTGLTFPFYSKYSQYSLSFILGTILVILEKHTYKDNREKAIT